MKPLTVNERADAMLEDFFKTPMRDAIELLRRHLAEHEQAVREACETPVVPRSWVESESPPAVIVGDGSPLGLGVWVTDWHGEAADAICVFSSRQVLSSRELRYIRVGDVPTFPKPRVAPPPKPALRLFETPDGERVWFLDDRGWLSGKGYSGQGDWYLLSCGWREVKEQEADDAP